MVTKKNDTSWIITHDGNGKKPFGHECLRCGDFYELPRELLLNDFLKIANAFINLHKLCKATEVP